MVPRVQVVSAAVGLIAGVRSKVDVSMSKRPRSDSCSSYLVAQMTSTEESPSTWKGTTPIGKSSTPGYSPLSIEMNQKLSVAYCVNSVSATRFCREAVLEHGL